MKAVVYDSQRKLVVLDVPLPELGPNEVLIKVVNTGFCGSDHSMIESGSLRDGTIIGHEVSGTVADTGSAVRDVEMGSRIMIRPTYCGKCRECKLGKPYLCQVDRRTIGLGDFPGGFAEYLKVDPRMLIPIPEGVDSQNGALAEAFAASLHGIRCSGKEGGSALVIGGGSIGLALVRLLKVMGFGPIALSEPVEEKRTLAVHFGADTVIDPFHENLILRVMDETGGAGFDTVFECSGLGDSVQTAVNAAANGGTVCVVSIIMQNIEIVPVVLNFKEVWLTGSYSNTHEENIRCLRWMAEGKIDGRPLITDYISLDDLPHVYEERIHTCRAIKVMLRIGREF
ncbi:MAG: alcohol dehydrogenase catalytic domain-containing protein [Deltaproteobacteria bacterium]|nr:alcohol dehydrogenase catalytic domain-containing protein [Deltaproteobacteria bacterium]